SEPTQPTQRTDLRAAGELRAAPPGPFATDKRAGSKQRILPALALLCQHRRRTHNGSSVFPHGVGQTTKVVGFLLSVAFAGGLFIALAHVLNQRFIAPVYDVAANLTAFGCAVAASLLLGHPVPAALSAVAICCWLVLARRTILDRRRRHA